MPLLQRFFYYSRATSKAHMRGVINIVQVARAFTQNNAISGLLVLDGEYFCEYLEGPAPAMQFLIAKLKSDPRQAHMVVLLDGDLPGERLYSDWGMGLLVGQGLSLKTLESLKGEAALAHLHSIAPALEMVQ